MIRLVGVLLTVAVLYCAMLASDPGARTLGYQQQLAGWVGFYGVLTVGVGVLIIAGGIDLSIGSVVGLGAVCFGLLISRELRPVIVAVPIVLTLVGVVAHGAGGVIRVWFSPTRTWPWIMVATTLSLGFSTLVSQRVLGEWVHRGSFWSEMLSLLAAASVPTLIVWWTFSSGLLEGAGTSRAALANVLAGVVGILAAWWLLLQEVTPWIAAGWIIAASSVIGLVHGLLVTRLRLQPFLVTLCGLFIYRGLAKWTTSATVGRGASDTLRELLVGGYGEGGRNQLLVLLAVAAGIALFLHGTRHGRYLFAIGANEDAARYAGIPTDRYKVLAYVICSGMAGLGAILFLLQNDSANPTSAGSWLELYAITGAVLGGCSLRGGEGLIPGMILGAAVLPLLRALCAFNKVGSEVEYAVIGFALLLGTIADELLKRRTARRPA